MPGYVRMLFNRGPYEMPGGSSIVDANGWNASEGYDVNWAPSMRMVVDLSDLDASRWVNQTGNSGHAYDDHYDDQIAEWVSGETFPWPFSTAAVEDETHVTLTPSTPKSPELRLGPAVPCGRGSRGRRDPLSRRQ